MKTTENSSQDIDLEQFEANRKRYDAFRRSLRYRVFFWLYKQPIRVIFNNIQRGLRLADYVCERVKNMLLFK